MVLKREVHMNKISEEDDQGLKNNESVKRALHHLDQKGVRLGTVIALLDSGSVFGEQAIKFQDGHRQASIVSISPQCEMLVIG